MRYAILAALLSTALLAGCGGDDKSSPGASAGESAGSAPIDTIRIKDFDFIPPEATVKVGQKITIPNADTAPHTLTEETAKPSFDSDTIKGKQTGSVTFQKTGTFKYYCEFHPTMKATVTVTQ